MAVGEKGTGGRVPAAKRILEAASRLFYEEGIRAVGVEAVAAEAGVTKKTLYDNYGSKAALVSAYLRARDERWRVRVLDVADRGGGSPEDRILATFDALAELWEEQDNSRGCGFVNASAELADPEHPARAVIAEQKEWMREYMRGLAVEAGLSEPDLLVERLMILHEGASVAKSLDLASESVAKGIAALLIENHR